MTQDNPTPPPVDYAGTSAAKTGLFAPPPIPPEPAPPEQRTMGMLCHLLALSGLVGIPFGTVLGPLVIWLIKKNEMPFVNDQGKEALNFHISVIILAIILSPTICLAGLGLILLIAVGITALVFTIIATVKASSGAYYRYPYSMRLIK